MTCPKCGTATEVVKTDPSAMDGKGRLRKCDKHGLFWSLERFIRWVTGNSRVTRPQRTANAPPTDRQPPANEISGGGDRGGVSEGVDPSGMNSSSGLDPSASMPSGARARNKRHADTDPFEPEFEAEWNQTAKTGSKRKARRAWRKAGTPAFGVSWKRWEGCSEWRQDWFNYPHVSTWINDGRCAQEPTDAKQKQPSNGTVVPFAVRAEREREDRVAREQEDRMFGGSR